MDGIHPVEHGTGVDVGADGLHVDGRERLGADEVDDAQEVHRAEDVGDVWTHLGGEFVEDADDFALLLTLQLTYAVVGLHHLGRLYEDGLTRSRLVVDDALDFAFQRRCHGDDEASVAHGGVDVLVHKSLALGGVEDAHQLAADASGCRRQFAAYVVQLGRGCVLDTPVGIDDGVDAAHQPGEEERVLGQSRQTGVRPPFIALLLAEEPHDGVQRVERTAQVEQLRLA